MLTQSEFVPFPLAAASPEKWSTRRSIAVAVAAALLVWFVLYQAIVSLF